MKHSFIAGLTNKIWKYNPWHLIKSHTIYMLKIIIQSLWYVCKMNKNTQSNKSEIHRQSNTSQTLHISYPKILLIFVKMFTFLQICKVLQLLEIETEWIHEHTYIKYYNHNMHVTFHLALNHYIIEITRKRNRLRVFVTSVFKCKPRSLFA